MKQIDDLEPAYRKYATTFMTGFDSYPPVTINVLLPPILSDISTTNPPTPPLDKWSLDALFILPYTRLRYYRKLYARLLRSTKEGRSDHRLLLVANQRLEALVSECEARLDVDVSEEDPLKGSVSAPGSDGARSREQSWVEREKERISRTSSAMGSADSHPKYVLLLPPVEIRGLTEPVSPRLAVGWTIRATRRGPPRRASIRVRRDDRRSACRRFPCPPSRCPMKHRCRTWNSA